MSAIVVRTHSGEEVHRIDTSGRNEREIEKIEGGLARNFNFDEYTFGIEN